MEIWLVIGFTLAVVFGAILRQPDPEDEIDKALEQRLEEETTLYYQKKGPK